MASVGQGNFLLKTIPHYPFDVKPKHRLHAHSTLPPSVFCFSPAKITLTSARIFGIILAALSDAEVAQSVEQWTENPCVGSSILPLGIFISHFAREVSLS